MTEAPAKANFDPMNEVALADSLAFENEDLLKRTKALKATAEKWDKIETIEDDETAQLLTDYLRQVSNVVGDKKGLANIRREARKKPYDVCATVVQSFFKKQMLDVLTPYRAKFLIRLNTYLDKKQAAADAAAKKLADEAKAKAAAATTPDQIKEAMGLQKQSEKLAKSGGVKTDFGSSAHQTSRWAFDVEDITKVETKYLLVDQAAVMAVIRTGTVEKPVVIPGIKVYRKTGAVGT